MKNRQLRLYVTVTLAVIVLLYCAVEASANSGDIRATTVLFASPGNNNVTVVWNPPFPDTNYIAVCTAEQFPSDFLLPVITSRSPQSMNIVPTDAFPGGTLDCIAIPDSDGTDIRHTRAAFTGHPSQVTVPWNPVFTDSNYTAVCTMETQDYGNGEFTSVISAKTPDSITVTNGSGFNTGTMHCMAIPDSDISDVRRGRVTVSGHPNTVTVPWNQRFANGSYAAVCSDEVPGAMGSDSAIATYADSKLPASVVTIPEIQSGLVDCIAILTRCAASVVGGCGP
jgi:hypothetical protein